LKKESFTFSTVFHELFNCHLRLLYYFKLEPYDNKLARLYDISPV